MNDAVANRAAGTSPGADLALGSGNLDQVGAVGILDDTVLDEGVAVQLISVLTRMEAACAAARVKVTHLLHRSRLAKVEDGLPERASKTFRARRLAAVGRSTAAEVALARQQSPSMGSRLVEQARMLCEELPHTYAELAEGRLTQQRAALIAEAAGRLPQEVRAEFDRRAALVTAGKSDARVRDALRGLSCELDQAGMVQRNRKDVKERYVSVRPHSEGMGKVTIVAPLAQAVAAYASLKRHADLARNVDGDPRTKAQIQCDEAISRLTCGAVQGCDDDGVPFYWAAPTTPSPTLIGDTLAPTGSFDRSTGDPVEEVRARARSAGSAAAVADRATALGGAGCDRVGGTKSTEGISDRAVPLAGSEHGRYGEAASPFDGGGSPGGDDGGRGRGEIAFFAVDLEGESPAGCHRPAEAAGGPPPAGLVEDGGATVLAPAGPELASVEAIGSDGAAVSTPAAGAPQIHLHVILTDRALLGLTDEPAEMIGYGTVPAFLARRLAVAGAGRPDDARTTLRRYLTDPVSGRLSDCDPRSRFFPDVMKEFLMVRDRVCRTPFCGAPIRQGDHVVRHADGGPTTTDNGQGLCQRCNLVKESGSDQIGHWNSRREPDGTIVITTPTGHRYLSPEPPATRDRGTDPTDPI